jgi:hypothetical protein
MPQPPTTPVLAHEDVRVIPSLSMKTFNVVGLAGGITTWEFDLAARISDSNQFLNANPAPANTRCTAGGGVGPQITPQPALGPLADAMVLVNGGNATLSMLFAVDANPCLYYQFFGGVVNSGIPANINGLRITGRFVMFMFTNVTLGATIELGFYVRNQ